MLHNGISTLLNNILNIPKAFSIDLFILITTNHNFSKGSNLIKVSSWTKKVFVLIKDMGHEKHIVLLVDYFE
jgi:hypothetical protein